MLKDDLFHHLGQIVKRPAFLPESIRGVSRAAESLCRWVRAVYQYACIQRHMAPQEARKNQLEARMAETRARLRVARMQEEETRERLENMERQQQLLKRDLDELSVQLRMAETLEREAAAAVQQVECHIADWNAAAEVTHHAGLHSGTLVIFEVHFTKKWTTQQQQQKERVLKTKDIMYI